ncbi:uncharacterized protein LOC133791559 [Humulus lupulus]|uniref:uncharacterized protein LOC133791559 n=1 Tax=Humulus lupulus TaxID=3486 RepID=UPI002B40FBF5|nr:uncharacterized protein LOC133791559 [Humulus lupulus]
MRTQTVLESANVVIDDAKDFFEFSTEEEIDRYIDEPSENHEEAYVSDTIVATSGPSVPTDHESNETDSGRKRNFQILFQMKSKRSHQPEEGTMVKTRGDSSKKTPTTQSRKLPSPSPPPSVSTAPPPAPAPAAFVGKTPKSKARKKSKKNSVAPKRKLGLDSSSSPLTTTKKRLKAHPLSPSSSESELEEAKSESEETHDTTLSDEFVHDNAELEAESNEPEQEDVVPTEQEAESDTETVTTPLSSKAKGKRPIFDSTPSPRLSGVIFKPHSSILCYNDNARDMVLYDQRKFLIKKNYVWSDHRPYGVLTMFQDRKWIGSLVKFTGFVDRIVKEFYANLTNEIIDPKSPLYCKVYVRGHWCSFSPQDIAQALYLPLDVKDDDDLASLNKDEVITELVGQKMVWPPNTVISVTNLTYTYAVLHKFATMNWKPTSHTVTISFDMTSFLYKVGTEIGIDLAMFIYDQIIGFQKGHRRNLNLPFPQVIYKVLSMQKKDLKRDQEDLVAPTSVASYKASAPTTEAADALSTKKAKPQSLKTFLLNPPLFPQIQDLLLQN